jgi:hypothetical protein
MALSLKIKQNIAVVLIFICFIPTVIKCENQEKTNREKLINIVLNWASAHTNQNYEAFGKLYYEKVEFYTQNISKENCLRLKHKGLDGNEGFTLIIVSKIETHKLKEDLFKCSFTKKAMFRDFEKEYPSYLVILKKNDDFFIVGESDLITDKNLKYKFNIDKFPTSTNANHDDTNKLLPEKEGKGSIFLQLAPLILIILIIIFAFFIAKNRSKKAKSKYLNKRKANTDPSLSDNSETQIDYLKMGHDFEGYVVGKFNKKYFRFKHWRSDKAVGEQIPESNTYPDLEFEFTCYDYSKKFAVECKYRSNANLEQYEICRADQIERYRDFEKHQRIEVYIVLGIGGEPLNPKELYVIPLKKLYSTTLHRSKLKNFYKQKESDFFYNRNEHRLT